MHADAGLTGMGADFRKIEMLLEEFFRRERAPTCFADGDLYVGVREVIAHISKGKIEGATTMNLVACSAGDTVIVSLTDLAKYLAREIG